MNLNIQIIDVETTTAPTKNGGSYEKAVVTHKNLASGKTEAKTLISFKNEEVFQLLSKASKGETYLVVSEKNDKYWEWVKAEKSDGSDAAAPAAEGAPKARPAQSNEYEAKEAHRQLMIVRQSSLERAIMIDPKAKWGDLLDLSDKIVDYVYNGQKAAVPTGVDAIGADALEDELEL